MENLTGEGQIAEQPPIVDILDGHYKVSYTGINNLPKLLKGGLYSGKFAARIGDNKYHDSIPSATLANEKYVWLNSKIGNNYSSFSYKDAVGILVDGSSLGSSEIVKVLFRIAPREFAGIVILDDYSHPGLQANFSNPRETRRFVDQRIEEIKAILAETHMDLPIYGSTGNLYWPERMSHDQIVRRNFGRARNPISNLFQAVSRVIKRTP